MTTNISRTVVATLQYNKIQSLLLTAPPYVLAVIAAMANAWHADKTGERFLHIVIPLCFALIAFVMAAATTSTGPRYCKHNPSAQFFILILYHIPLSQ